MSAHPVGALPRITTHPTPVPTTPLAEHRENLISTQLPISAYLEYVPTLNVQKFKCPFE